MNHRDTEGGNVALRALRISSTLYSLPPTLYPLLSTPYPTNSRMGECSTRYWGRPVGSRMVVLAVLMPRL